MHSNAKMLKCTWIISQSILWWENDKVSYQHAAAADRSTVIHATDKGFVSLNDLAEFENGALNLECERWARQKMTIATQQLGSKTISPQLMLPAFIWVHKYFSLENKIYPAFGTTKSFR